MKAHRRRVMQRARDRGAAAPAVGGRIVDLELALAAEAADHVDLAVHLGDRHLGARGRHRRAGGPAALPCASAAAANSGAAGQYRRGEGLELGHLASIRRWYWLDMDDRILVMLMVNGIGANLTNDKKELI